MTQGRGIYQQVVAWTRHPYFYTDLAVVDHVLTRFELLSLHLGLLMRRFSQERSLCQTLADTLVLDLDACLRDLPINDWQVGREVKRLARAFYGRLRALDLALRHKNENSILDILERNLYIHSPQTPMDCKMQLVKYTSFLDEWLAGESAASITHKLPMVSFNTMQS
ncbi:MAG: ubiquinol-cytochrome C chaperone family protein [Alphaproteobacteria bacterium]